MKVPETIQAKNVEFKTQLSALKTEMDDYLRMLGYGR